MITDPECPGTVIMFDSHAKTRTNVMIMGTHDLVLPHLPASLFAASIRAQGTLGRSIPLRRR